MRGHERFKDGAWRLVVEAGTDPIRGTARREPQSLRTVLVGHPTTGHARLPRWMR